MTIIEGHMTYIERPALRDFCGLCPTDQQQIGITRDLLVHANVVPAGKGLQMPENGYLFRDSLGWLVEFIAKFPQF